MSPKELCDLLNGKLNNPSLTREQRLEMFDQMNHVLRKYPIDCIEPEIERLNEVANDRTRESRLAMLQSVV